MEIEQRYVIKFFADEGIKPLDIMMRPTNITVLASSVDPHYTSGLARRDGAEQTFQKLQDPTGLSMKVWRPS
jgi:hypothetical protein